MDQKAIIRDQFNRQANRFSNWPVTRNEEYMRRYFEFSEISADDEMLDLACGSGEYGVFCAKRVQRVQGIDISQGMIAKARSLAAEAGLGNIAFDCGDVEKIPVPGGSFSVVSCRSAFHHMQNHARVFEEMLRCCRPQGRLALQDIMAYDDPHVNSFFEALEREIDVSHNATLHRSEFEGFFDRGHTAVIRSAEVEVELNFRDYLAHAVQTVTSRGKIADLLACGLRDRNVSRFLTVQNGQELVLKRNVFLILGCKAET